MYKIKSHTEDTIVLGLMTGLKVPFVAFDQNQALAHAFNLDKFSTLVYAREETDPNEPIKNFHKDLQSQRDLVAEKDDLFYKEDNIEQILLSGPMVQTEQDEEKVFNADTLRFRDFSKGPKGTRLWEDTQFYAIVTQKDTAFLSFRGTEAPDFSSSDKKEMARFGDFFTDADAAMVPFAEVPNSGRVHQGFYQEFMNVKDALEVFLGDDVAYQGIEKFIITGHSLGGAVATITACYLHSKGMKVVLSTYGQPKAGDQDFAKAFNGKFPYVRYVHEADPVARVPLTEVPWNEYFDGSEGNWDSFVALVKYMGNDFGQYIVDMYREIQGKDVDKSKHYIHFGKQFNLIGDASDLNALWPTNSLKSSSGKMDLKSPKGLFKWYVVDFADHKNVNYMRKFKLILDQYVLLYQGVSNNRLKDAFEVERALCDKAIGLLKKLEDILIICIEHLQKKVDAIMAKYEKLKKAAGNKLGSVLGGLGGDSNFEMPSDEEIINEAIKLLKLKPDQAELVKKLYPGKEQWDSLKAWVHNKSAELQKDVNELDKQIRESVDNIGKEWASKKIFGAPPCEQFDEVAQNWVFGVEEAKA